MEIDRVPVSQLPSRYGIARSALYTHLKDLKIFPEKTTFRTLDCHTGAFGVLGGSKLAQPTEIVILASYRKKT